MTDIVNEVAELVDRAEKAEAELERMRKSTPVDVPDWWDLPLHCVSVPERNHEYVLRDPNNTLHRVHKHHDWLDPIAAIVNDYIAQVERANVAKDGAKATDRAYDAICEEVKRNEKKIVELQAELDSLHPYSYEVVQGLLKEREDQTKAVRAELVASTNGFEACVKMRDDRIAELKAELAAVNAEHAKKWAARNALDGDEYAEIQRLTMALEEAQSQLATARRDGARELWEIFGLEGTCIYAIRSVGAGEIEVKAVGSYGSSDVVRHKRVNALLGYEAEPKRSIRFGPVYIDPKTGQATTEKPGLLEVLAPEDRGPFAGVSAECEGFGEPGPMGPLPPMMTMRLCRVRRPVLRRRLAPRSRRRRVRARFCLARG